MQHVAQERARGIAPEVDQAIEGDAPHAVVSGHAASARQERAQRFAAASGGDRTPFVAVGEYAGAAAIERGARERLQRMLDDQRGACGRGAGEVLAAEHVEQFGDQGGGLARLAGAQVAADPGQVQGVIGRGQQLQEQVAVVVAHRAVAEAALVAQVVLEPTDAVGGFAAREGGVVEAEHRDHAERDCAQRHHAAEADAAAQEALLRVRLGEAFGEEGAHGLPVERLLAAAGVTAFGQRRQRRAQQIQRATFIAIRAVTGQQRVQRALVQGLPLAAAVRQALRGGQPLQLAQHQQGLAEGRRGVAFDQRHRRNGADVALVAGGVADQQTFDAFGPAEGAVVAGAEGLARAGIEAPAHAGGVQPVGEVVERAGVEAKAPHHRGHREQIKQFALGPTRGRQREQLQEHPDDRVLVLRAAVGDRVRNAARIAGRQRAEHRVDRRRVFGDVRHHHRDVAWLQGGVALEQREQAVVQHLDFAQRRMTDVETQRNVVRVRRRDALAGARAAQFEDVGLHAAEQGRARRLAQQRILVGRLHLVVGEHLVEELTADAAPRSQQRLLGLLQRRGAGAQAFAHAAQVAPVFTARRRQVEIDFGVFAQGAEHAQHVRRDVEAAEHR